MARRAIVAVGMVVAGVLLAWGQGLEPSAGCEPVRAHGVEDPRGFTKGAIYAIAQTPDSYLWLGTEFGLLRFDGGQGRSGAGASGLESSFEHCESRSARSARLRNR
jgi:hypothetical protein